MNVPNRLNTTPAQNAAFWAKIGDPPAAQQHYAEAHNNRAPVNRQALDNARRPVERMANNADPSTMPVATQRVNGHSNGAKGTSATAGVYNPSAPPMSVTPGYK